MENPTVFRPDRVSTESDALPPRIDPGALILEAYEFEPPSKPAMPLSETVGEDGMLNIEPIDYGGNSEHIVLAQAGDDDKPLPQPEDQEAAAKAQEDALRQSLLKAFIKPEDGTTKRPEEIVKAIESAPLPALDKLGSLDKLDIPEIDDRIEFEPDLWHKIKENPLISALVLYGGYQVIKQGRKFVLQRQAKEAPAVEGSTSEKSEKSEKTEKPVDKNAETVTKSGDETEVERRGRKPRIVDGESPTRFEERVEAEKNTSGVFERKLASGSAAILGSDRAAESLTRSEVDTIKEEIRRLKESKVEAENKRAQNLERVVKILENSDSPRVQEAAHKYIRSRIAEGNRKAEAERSGGGKLGRAVGIGIIISAALAYYMSTLDHQPNLEEENRAGVSGK
ncbi:hypothetical protein GC174_09465 [bacterium]|nr:hypothetical protein [bacterium]